MTKEPQTFLVMNDDFRELIETKFDLMGQIMNERHTVVLDKLKDLSTETKEIRDSISNVKDEKSKHYIECPHGKKINEFVDKFDDRMTEVNFFHKHPMALVYSILVIVILTISSNIYFNNKTNTTRDHVSTISSQVSDLNKKVDDLSTKSIFGKSNK